VFVFWFVNDESVVIAEVCRQSDQCQPRSHTRSNIIPDQLGKSAKAEDAGPKAAWHVRYRTETIFLIRVAISTILAIGISAVVTAPVDSQLQF